MENIYVDFEITKDDLNKFNLILQSVLDWSVGKVLEGPYDFTLVNSRKENIDVIMNSTSIFYLFFNSKDINFVFNRNEMKPDAKEFPNVFSSTEEQIKNNNKKANKEKDNVNHPSHYATGKYECIDVMIELYGIEFVKDFCLGNTFKYLYRAKRKNGIEDIQKAAWYLNKYLSLEEEK